MMRAIVTGASSMLGATLTAELLSHGAQVLAIVRPNSPKRGNLPEHPRLQIAERELSEYTALEPTDGEPYDVCYHLAWNGTYGKSRDDLYAQNLNVRHALDAVALAKRFGCKRFIGVGSQAECGRIPDGMRVSPDTPTFPVSGYGAAKLSANLLARIRAEQLGVGFSWVRVVSVYGPMDNEYTLTMSTLRRLLRGEHVSFTKGEQVWDFLYAEDAARAFRLIGEKGRDGALYVLGSGQPIRLSEALTTLAHTVSPNASFGLGELAYRPDQCMHLCADISALTADTGFTPQVGYAEGVRRTLAWCKSHPLG